MDSINVGSSASALELLMLFDGGSAFEMFMAVQALHSRRPFRLEGEQKLFMKKVKLFWRKCWLDVIHLRPFLPS